MDEVQQFSIPAEMAAALGEVISDQYRGLRPETMRERVTITYQPRTEGLADNSVLVVAVPEGNHPGTFEINHVGTIEEI